MADNPAAQVLSAGATVTELSGAGVGVDTVPAGTLLLMRNTGAGTHVVTLVNNATVDGLASTNRTHTIATAGIRVARVPALYGDANGRVGISVDGTSAEVKYYILGA